jgi:hypothetical protein
MASVPLHLLFANCCSAAAVETCVTLAAWLMNLFEMDAPALADTTSLAHCKISLPVREIAAPVAEPIADEALQKPAERGDNSGSIAEPEPISSQQPVPHSAAHCVVRYSVYGVPVRVMPSQSLKKALLPHALFLPSSSLPSFDLACPLPFHPNPNLPFLDGNWQRGQC